VGNAHHSEFFIQTGRIMPAITRSFIFIGAVSAFLAVTLGAFGAHILKVRLSPEMMATYQTGVQYHFYHTIGLLIVGILGLHLPKSGYIQWSGWLMVCGVVLFSGSLYLLSLTGFRWFGAVTPLGGTAFIAAWLLLAVAVLKKTS
jgi:uncharacterized membrane protein YgdD (TMEM256/DUF423 family)